MYVTSREVKNTKYVANFHTKAAADEYEEYLKSLLGVDRELVGVTRVRNSVVYTMECFKKGYTLSKQFEDAYIAKMAPPAPAPVVVPEPEPEPIPEPVAIEPEPMPEPEPVVEVIEIVEEPVTEEYMPNIDETSELLEEITEEELAQAAEDFVEEPSVFDEPKTGVGPLSSKITSFFKGNNKINTN